jgi:enoyl-[acyl-carrier protein] reductase II
VKAQVIKSKDRDTVVTGRSTGHPVRVLKNRLSREIMALDSENKAEEIEALGAGKLAVAMRDGDIQMGSLMAGQASAMVCEIQPAAEIVGEMLSEAETVMARLGLMLSEA